MTRATRGNKTIIHVTLWVIIDNDNVIIIDNLSLGRSRTQPITMYVTDYVVDENLTDLPEYSYLIHWENVD